VATRPRKNSKNSASRSGEGGAVAGAESFATCRAALNSSSGLSSRTPNAASISPAFRAVRNSWKPLNACTYVRRVDAAMPAAAQEPTTRSTSSRVTSQAGLPKVASTRSSRLVALSTVTWLKPRATQDAA
jgi:hypothetical protein